MELWREILSPDFLLRNSVYVSLLAGFACPVIGVFLVLRRLLFLGVALPHISSAGIALVLSLHIWFGHDSSAHETNEQKLAFLGSISLTTLAILGFSALERRGRGLVEGRLGMAYAIAIAASILLLAKCPQAEHGWLHLLKGEIITVSNADLWTAIVAFGIVLGCLCLFQKEFLLVSFDRELAFTLQKNVAAWDLFLYLLLGATIAVAVLILGPLMTFGFLLMPTLISHLFAATMRRLALVASAVGGFTSLAGFWVAYKWDLPVGPTDVALLGLLYVLALLARRAWLAWRGTRPARQ